MTKHSCLRVCVDTTPRECPGAEGDVCKGRYLITKKTGLSTDIFPPSNMAQVNQCGAQFAMKISKIVFEANFYNDVFTMKLLVVT